VRAPEVPYVPGQTPRPADGTYDSLRNTAQAGMTPAQLAGCDAWTVGWRFLEAGCHWEAHEVWEAVWLALPQNSAERRFVQAVIQLANGLLKEKMGRPAATLRLCAACHTGLAGLSSDIMATRIDTVRQQVQALEVRARAKCAL